LTHTSRKQKQNIRKSYAQVGSFSLFIRRISTFGHPILTMYTMYA